MFGLAGIKSPVLLATQLYFSFVRSMICAIQDIALSLFSFVFGAKNEEATELSVIERHLILPFLRNCRIPGHVGFIMDGNRRFARASNSPTLFGHRMGYDRLRKVLLWCFELGVKEVSAYAFSMDNFSRSKEEVDYLMDLAESKLETLCEEGGFVMRHKIRVRICGSVELLRPSLQQVIQRVEARTSTHTGGTFNVLMAYSSKREVFRAVELASCVSKSQDASWDLIQSKLHIPSNVDLIVRTSGETRLSDFLIWQIQPESTLVVFERNLWPAFSLLDFSKCLLKYHYYRTTEKLN